MKETMTAQYESPLCTELEIDPEGILCGSGIIIGPGHEGIDGSDDEIFKD